MKLNIQPLAQLVVIVSRSLQVHIGYN